MADTPTQSNQPIFNLPTRNITITGEYSARMVQNTVRVSRLEQRSIQIAMAPPAVRDAGRRAMDRLIAAHNAFEAELAQVEKDIEATSRSNGQRRNGNRPQEGQKLSRNTPRSGSGREGEQKPQGAGGQPKAAVAPQANQKGGGKGAGKTKGQGQSNQTPNAQKPAQPKKGEQTAAKVNATPNPTPVSVAAPSPGNAPANAADPTAGLPVAHDNPAAAAGIPTL